MDRLSRIDIMANILGVTTIISLIAMIIVSVLYASIRSNELLNIAGLLAVITAGTFGIGMSITK